MVTHSTLLIVVLVELVSPLVVLVFPLVVLACPFVCPFVVLVRPLVVSVCSLVVSAELSVGVFITDPVNTYYFSSLKTGAIIVKCS